MSTKRLCCRSMLREQGLVALFLVCFLLIAVYEYNLPQYMPDVSVPNEPVVQKNKAQPHKGIRNMKQTTKSIPKTPDSKSMEQQVKKTCYIVFTVTRYESTQDVRFRTCLDLISQCLEYDTPIVIVDSSPSEEVYQELKKSGAIVHRQKQKGRKGAALREAAEIASQLPGVTPFTLLCWQEPEKVGMVRHWRRVFKVSDNDVVIPYRSIELFEKTYPAEQFHSELYGNLYLDAVATRQLGKQQWLPSLDDGIARDMKQSKHKLPRVDWHFGPLAFKAKHVHLWTKYKGGDSYDAQLVPLVHAMRKKLSFSSVHVDYEAPLEMKQQEEGNVAFIEKRLTQLNELDPRVKQAWTEEYYC